MNEICFPIHHSVLILPNADQISVCFYRECQLVFFYIENNNTIRLFRCQPIRYNHFSLTSTPVLQTFILIFHNYKSYSVCGTSADCCKFPPICALRPAVILYTLNVWLNWFTLILLNARALWNASYDREIVVQMICCFLFSERFSSKIKSPLCMC